MRECEECKGSGIEEYYAGHGCVGEADCSVCMGSSRLPAYGVSVDIRGKPSAMISESDLVRIYFSMETLGLDGVCGEEVAR